MHFNFDPALQDTWVQGQLFPHTPKMPRVVRAAKKGGCKIVGLTGRNNAQRDATLDNLAKFYTDKATGKRLFKSKFYFTKWTSDRAAAGVRRLRARRGRHQVLDDRVQVLDPQVRRAPPQARHHRQLR